MGGWGAAKRTSPEGEEDSASDSKLTKSRGKGSMKASAKSAASYEDTQVCWRRKPPGWETFLVHEEEEEAQRAPEKTKRKKR